MKPSLNRLSFYSLLLFLCLTSGALLAPRAAGADPQLKNAIVTLAPISGARNVEMSAQIFDVTVIESGENTVLAAQLTFKLHNTDKLTPTELLVGFPAWGGGATEWNDKSFAQFSVTENGNPVVVQPQTQPLRIGNETRNVRWLTFPISLAEDERTTVEAKFRQDLGDGALPTIAFVQAPAILWKGYVGSARFSVQFASLTTPEQFRFIAPAGSAFSGKSLTWLFAEYNPEAPVILQLIKPRIWREITQARNALARGNDVRAALTLGAQYAQLARASLSAGDLAQAVAAYQRASEMDPNSPAAPLELAKLYEAKLRGEFGKNDDENGARAAALEQWQKALRLNPNNGEARDAVAQHALVLAQTARRNNLFSGALLWLDIARTANSAKVSRAQIEEETYADHAGLIMQRMEAGQWAEAFRRIQAEAAGAEAKHDRDSFQPLFASAQATVHIADGQTTASARVVPYPAPSSEHERILNDWLSGAQRLSVEGNLTGEGDAYVLHLRFAAKPLPTNELKTPLELLILRNLLSPGELRTSHSEDLFTSDDGFSARYDLREPQQAAQSKLDEIDRALKALSAPATDETREMVRRMRLRALEQYRVAWQSLINSSDARIEWRATLGQGETWELRAGDARALQSQRTTYQLWAIAVVACLAIGGLGLMGIGGWLFLKRK